MKAFRKWKVAKQVGAEMDVLFALADHPQEWIPGILLANSPRISPWWFIGALTRLTVSKKVQVMNHSDGSRSFKLTALGREEIVPAVAAPE